MTTATGRDKEFFSTHDAAKICRVTPMTVIRWIKEGKIPAFTTAGGHRRIARDDLVRFCRSRGIPFPVEAEPEAGRVLVVDGDAAVRDAVAEAARAVDEKLLIEMAGDAFGAGQALAMFRPQLLFLDHRLPGIDAPELVARLARAPEGDPLSIAVMVASGGADVERTFRNRGALGCVTKPPSRAAVDRLVRAVFHLPSGNGHPINIHVIDPDPRAGRLVRRELETRLPGCRVTIFESPIDALFAMPLERPDLVLLDCAEVDLGPAELIRRILTHQGGRPLPIVALGSADAQKEALLAAGAKAVLGKPCGVDDIVAHLQQGRGGEDRGGGRKRR
jgi:excisionase family DNA binding protein